MFCPAQSIRLEFIPYSPSAGFRSSLGYTYWQWKWVTALYHININKLLIMKPGGKSFTGSISMLETNRRLRTMIGKNKTWFNQYRPIAFPEKDIIEQFLFQLFKLNICCHIAGSFAAYTAGILHSYAAIMLHLASTDCPLQTSSCKEGFYDQMYSTWTTFVFN